MSWRRRLRDIAMAGGLAGCTAQVMGGGSTTTTTSGSGGSTTSSSNANSSGGPACNANPDPCCMCSIPNDGQGGYGGAACVGKAVEYIGDAGITCEDELACIKAPTKACCDALPALQSLDAGHQVDPALRALGVLSYEDRVEAFYTGIERVALPRLTRLGFDAQRLWADRYRS